MNIIGTSQLLWDTPVKGLTLSGKAGINYNNNFDKIYRAATYFDANKTVGPATLVFRPIIPHIKHLRVWPLIINRSIHTYLLF